MKVVTPEISWHERDPIYSVDFQPGQHSIQRLASGGVDKIVRIWQMSIDSEGKAEFEFLSNLRRHTATVNVVRFSKDGKLLATAGDDTAIILWKLSDVPVPANNIFAEDDAEDDKETWVCHKTLRGHLGDVLDLSWSKDNRFLVSGSVDNSAVLWDVTKGTKLALFNEHKSYVQGVAFDPLGNFVATLSADRSLRIYSTSSKSCVNNVSKMSQPSSAVPAANEDGDETAKPKTFRIFHDDSLRSFFRRPEFSPDGQLLFTPAGCMEVADKLVNTSFVFSRAAFSKPSMYLPSGDKSSTVVRVNPKLFQLRPMNDVDETPKEGISDWEKHKSLFCLPYRMVYAVATEDCVLIYDTQQTLPISLLRNIHYHQLSDLSWSSNGRSLIVSSTDGFCTIVTFEKNELGELYTDADMLNKEEHENSLETPRKDKSSPVSNKRHQKTPTSQDKCKVKQPKDEAVGTMRPKKSLTPEKEADVADAISSAKTEIVKTLESIKLEKTEVKIEMKSSSVKVETTGLMTEQEEKSLSVKVEEKEKSPSVKTEEKEATLMTVRSKGGETPKEEQPKIRRIQFTTLSK